MSRYDQDFRPTPRRSSREPTMMDSAMIQGVTMGLDGAVENFLAAGANPNGTDEHGVPIIHLAFSGESDLPSIEKIARMMVAAGANPKAPHAAGPSLPERIVRLFSAGGGERLINLISSLGFEMDARGPKGRTALMYAVENPAISDAVVEALLRGGADPSSTDANGRSAYDIAENLGRKEALMKMAIIQERGALEAITAGAVAPSRKPPTL